MREARQRQVGEGTSWTKVRGPAGAIFCEMKDRGVAVPSWQVLRMGAGRMTHQQHIDEACQRCVLAKLGQQRNMQIGELTERVWFEPVSGVTKSRLTMLPKLELQRGSFMEFSSGTRLDIKKRWKRNWRKK